MALIDKLWLATMTKNKKDAGTDANRLNLTVDVDGQDVFDQDFTFLTGSGFLSGGLGPDKAWLGRGQAAISPFPEDPLTLSTPFESSLLTNSSIRLGIRSDDAWGPESALLLGGTERQTIALAMETEIDRWLSTDPKEGKLTMPLRLVGSGSSLTVIRRVMLLVYTGGGANVGTDSPIELQITAGGVGVLQQQIPTEKDDLEEYTGNWYFLAADPFIRGDVISNGGIELRILGKDAWTPKQLFVFGLDTAIGRPNEVVSLVSIREWNLGTLSADPSEGQASVTLPVM